MEEGPQPEPHGEDSAGSDASNWDDGDGVSGTSFTGSQEVGITEDMPGKCTPVNAPMLPLSEVAGDMRAAAVLTAASAPTAAISAPDAPLAATAPVVPSAVDSVLV